MILGIISFVVMPHILGPVSWIMGYLDLKKMRRGEMDPEGESQTRTGMICGMISSPWRLRHRLEYSISVFPSNRTFSSKTLHSYTSSSSNPN